VGGGRDTQRKEEEVRKKRCQSNSFSLISSLSPPPAHTALSLSLSLSLSPLRSISVRRSVRRSVSPYVCLSVSSEAQRPKSIPVLYESRRPKNRFPRLYVHISNVIQGNICDGYARASRASVCVGVPNAGAPQAPGFAGRRQEGRRGQVIRGRARPPLRERERSPAPVRPPALPRPEEARPRPAWRLPSSAPTRRAAVARSSADLVKVALS
jgi:hypothetical protein